MFYIRLSPSFDVDDCVEDIELPEVPAVGDTIMIDLGEGVPATYRVKARRFRVDFLKRKQIKLDRLHVLLHVEEVTEPTYQIL